MLTLSGTYEYQSEFARRYVAEGRKQGRKQGRQEGRQEGRLETARTMVLSLATRRGPLAAALRARVEACTDLALLHAVALDIAGAPDRPAVTRVLGRLPASQASTARSAADPARARPRRPARPASKSATTPRRRAAR